MFRLINSLRNQVVLSREIIGDAILEIKSILGPRVWDGRRIRRLTKDEVLMYGIVLNVQRSIDK